MLLDTWLGRRGSPYQALDFNSPVISTSKGNKSNASSRVDFRFVFSEDKEE